MEYQLDMSMMFAMHDALRRELAQVARIGRRTGDHPGQLLRAALGWELFKKFLLVHHQSEDDTLWPTLRTNVAGQPDRVALADALEAEHAVIEPLLTAIDAAAADPDYGYQRFGDIVDELAPKLTAHLAHEETDGLPLVGALPARIVIAAGMLLCAGGLAWYVTMLTPASDYFAVMLPAMLAGGTGTGLTFVGCTVTGMRGVAPRDSGVAAGPLNTSVQVGSALRLGALAAIASMVTRSRLEGHAVAVALTDGYVARLLAGAVIFAAGAVVAICTVNARISAAEAAAR